jgi:threonine aldolase
MRQVGIIAAGALHALHHHRERLVEDHARAARLAEVLGSLPAVEVFPVETNIVIVELEGTGRDPAAVVNTLEEKGVLAVNIGPTRIRFVTHLDVSDEGLAHADAVLRSVLGGTT